MSRENPFDKPPQEEKKEPVNGEGFTMGETSETARAREEREEKEEAERERLRQEFREKEAKMTPEEKTKRAEEWERQDRNWMAEWFEDGIAKSGEYSETLIIKQEEVLIERKD